MSPAEKPGRKIAEAYARYEEQIRAFLRRRLGANDDVDDLTQETFLRAQRAGRFDELDNQRAYLLRIADNLLRDRHRRNRLDLFDANLEASQNDPPDPAPSPERIAGARQELELLGRVVAELSPNVRDALILHKFHHLSYTQIGSVLGISPRTVEKHLAKAVAHCRASRSSAADVRAEADNVVDFACGNTTASGGSR